MSSNMSSPPASTNEISLIFIGVIFILLIAGFITFFFLRRKNSSSSTSKSTPSPTKFSNFAQINFDRQQEELKKVTMNSSLNTPYITTNSNNLLYQ